MDTKQASLNLPTHSYDQGDFHDGQSNSGYLHQEYSNTGHFYPDGDNRGNVSAPHEDYAPGYFSSQNSPMHQSQVMSHVVVTQPTYIYAQEYVPSYMPLAIFACLCCCWPLGLAAIVKSSQSQKALARNDVESAKSYSSSSITLSVMSIVAGMIITPFVILWHLGIFD